MDDLSQFYKQQYDALKARIEAYNTAILAITVEGVQSYTLDTGQTVTTVTQQNVTQLENAIPRMMSQLEVLQTRLTGCGVVTGRPGW